jgi:hypothetical protein
MKVGYSMKECIIKLPSTIHSSKKGYSKLIETIQPLFEMPNNTHFILDFSQIKWLDANLLAIIGAAIEHRHPNCRFEYLKGSINDTQADLWGRNGFGRYFKLEVPKRYDTTVDYTVFKSEKAKEFGLYIDDNLLTKNGFPQLSPELKKRISNNIQEIFGNAPLHGKCYNVISCGQYYPSQKKLTFTIVDCGITINKNVEEYFLYLRQPIPTHSIKWATIENNSTKQIVNGKSGGMGLALLKEFIGLNKGRLQICSGNEFWEYTTTKESSSHIDFKFPGTIVTITINMNDHNSYLLKDEIENTENINNLF